MTSRKTIRHQLHFLTSYSNRRHDKRLGQGDLGLRPGSPGAGVSVSVGSVPWKSGTSARGKHRNRSLPARGKTPRRCAGSSRRAAKPLPGISRMVCQVFAVASVAAPCRGSPSTHRLSEGAVRSIACDEMRIESSKILQLQLATPRTHIRMRCGGGTYRHPETANRQTGVGLAGDDAETVAQDTRTARGTR